MQVRSLRPLIALSHRTVTDAASAECLCRCCDLGKLQPIIFDFDIEMMYIQKGAFHKKLSLSATFEIQTGLAISGDISREIFIFRSDAKNAGQMTEQHSIS